VSTTPVTVYVNGKLITSDPDQPTAEAIAVADGHLLAVGSEREARAAGPAARVVEPGGR
jgi:predicted amidohydrolase YtcJ